MYVVCSLFFFNEPATTQIYTYCPHLSLHDALPIFVDARKAFRLTGRIAAEGQFPIATVDEGGILRAQIEGQPGRVGQFIAAKVSKKAAPAIRRAADLAAPRIGIRRIIGHQRSDSIGIIWRKGIVSERSEEHTSELQSLMR